MAPPVITEHPANQTTTLGSTLAFRVNATGAGQLTYQWQRNGVSLVDATSFIIVEHIAKYDRAKKKWFRDSTGVWGYLTPHSLYFGRFGGHSLRYGSGYEQRV